MASGSAAPSADGQASTSDGVSHISADASSSAGPSLASNPNMHFDKMTGKWMYEDTETGTEYEWNTVANTWVPVVDEEMLEAQQKAYSVEGVDESAPANSLLARDRKKKRKAEEGETGDAKKKAVKANKGPRNTAVYLQRLPLDATVEEVNSVFSKAGLILLDADGKPKIKLYTDSATGQRNGDGLVVYYKEESVQLAVSLLDDSPLRLGEKETMKVAKADWSHKPATDKEEDKEKSKGKNLIAQKMQRRAEKLQKEAADYDPSYDDKDSPVVANTTAAKTSGRVVVLAHVFTLQELEEDASLLLDLKEDIREECENIGKVTNVILYDKEPDGIVTVKFSDPISAQACVIKNNNRYFGGRQLRAWIYDGKTRYQKGGVADFLAKEGEGEDDAEKRRLEEFGKWLEAEDA